MTGKDWYEAQQKGACSPYGSLLAASRVHHQSRAFSGYEGLLHGRRRLSPELYRERLLRHGRKRASRLHPCSNRRRPEGSVPSRPRRQLVRGDAGRLHGALLHGVLPRRLGRFTQCALPAAGPAHRRADGAVLFFLHGDRVLYGCGGRRALVRRVAAGNAPDR